MCPQQGIALGGEDDSPLLAMAEADPALDAKMRGLPGAVLGSEDCLHLAVHTPVLPSADNDPELPVMVGRPWFYPPERPLSPRCTSTAAPSSWAAT